MRPPIWIPFLADGRWTARDLWDFVKPGREAKPDAAERNPSTPFAATPLERLEAALEARGQELHDLRGFPRDVHYDTREWGYFRKGTRDRNIPDRAKPYGKRTAAKTTAVCLHTTAVEMGWRRFLGTPVQVGVDKRGDVVLCHDVCTLVAHGHAANRFSVGVEISGHSTILPEQAASARDVMRYVQAEVLRRRGLEGVNELGRVAVMTHFNATNERSLDDPGEKIWREVGNWAIDELGYVLGPVISTGRRVPGSWLT